MSHLYDDEFDDTWRYERFITTIQQRAGISWSKAERAAEATLATLAERISSGAARDLARELPGGVARWLEPVAIHTSDSTMFVLPWPLRPTSRLAPGANATSAAR